MFFTVVLTAKGQTLAGVVTDSLTGTALSGATVFINASSIGTVTTDSGTFEIASGQLTEFTLIVSYVGYQTAGIHITTNTIRQVIRLAKKTDQLNEVTVLPSDKDGWSKWGALFKEHFIGTTKAARHCTIEHPDLINFHFSKKSQVLTVFSASPLVIVNKYLGYRIAFDLIKFEVDFNTRRVAYTGFPQFSELPGNLSLKTAWEKNRMEMYPGSLMHFLRTVYAGSLTGSLYEVRRVLKRQNVERTRVRLLTKNFDSAVLDKVPIDSFFYYRRIRNQPEFFDYLSSEKISASQIVRRDSGAVLLDFDGVIHVAYKSKKQDNRYASLVKRGELDNDVSGLIMLIHRPVVITKTGQFFPPADLFLGGYWGWSEKLANQLPLDYADP